MLETVACWGLALGMMYSKTEGITSDVTRLLFGMGFILLGIINKAVDVYRVTHTFEVELEEDENGNITINTKKTNKRD